MRFLLLGGFCLRWRVWSAVLLVVHDYILLKSSHRQLLADLLNLRGLLLEARGESFHWMTDFRFIVSTLSQFSLEYSFLAFH